MTLKNGVSGDKFSSEMAKGGPWAERKWNTIATEIDKMIGASTTQAALTKLEAVASSATEIDERVLNYTIADVSTAETILVYVPWSGTVTGVYSVLEGAITVGDATVTLVTSADDAMASLTIANAASAAGDIDSDETITNATVAAGAYLKLATDGGSTDAQRLWVTIKIQIT